jgi:hypothetical protein
LEALGTDREYTKPEIKEIIQEYLVLGNTWLGRRRSALIFWQGRKLGIDCPRTGERLEDVFLYFKPATGDYYKLETTTIKLYT